MNSPLLHHQQPPMTVPLAQLPKSGTDIERDDVQRKLRRAIMLSITLMGLEIVGGLVSGSLAIVTDAAHLLSDVSGFAVSLFAVALAQKRPSTNYTYGYHQAEILGALTSVLIVWAMTGVLLFEATRRFINLAPVDGRLMLIMATTPTGGMVMATDMDTAMLTAAVTRTPSLTRMPTSTIITTTDQQPPMYTAAVARTVMTTTITPTLLCRLRAVRVGSFPPKT